MTNRTVYAYEYNDKLDLFDDKYKYNIIKNVPCYNLNDLAKILGKTSSFTTMSSLQFGRHILDTDTIAIDTGNYRGKKHYYVLATDQVRELVRLNTAFAVLKGHTTKTPKLHHKNIHLHLVNFMSGSKNKTLKYRTANIVKDMYKYRPVDAE